MKFEDVFEGYVIKEIETNTFIGDNSDCYRVALREHAARFTKKEALKYLSSGAFIEHDKTYLIQNA